MLEAPNVVIGSEVLVRLMLPGEKLPDKYRPDPIIDVLELDPDWVWIMEDANMTVIGYLVAAPCHRMVHILRATVDRGAPAAALAIMLRKFFADCRARKMKGFFAYFDTERPEEAQLARIAMKIGGRVLFTPVLAVGAPLLKEGT